MRNVPIEGGRDVGPPREWDAAASGECLTIHVLQILEGGSPYQTTAWQLGREEMAALRAGGHLFFSVNGHQVPVQRIWVQGPDGTLAGELQGYDASDLVFPASDARARRQALVAIADGLAARLGVDQVELQGMTTTGVISRIASLVDQVQPPATFLPVMTLDDLVAQGRVERVLDMGVGRPEPLRVKGTVEQVGEPHPDLPPPPGTRIRGMASGGFVSKREGPFRVGERLPEHLPFMRPGSNTPTRWGSEHRLRTAGDGDSAISREGYCDQWCDRREGGKHSDACEARRRSHAPPPADED